MPRLTQADRLKLIEALGYAIQWEKGYIDAVAESDPDMTKKSHENIKAYRKLVSKLKELSGVAPPAAPSAVPKTITILELIQRQKDSEQPPDAVEL